MAGFQPRPVPYVLQVRSKNDIADLIADLGGKMPREMKARIRPLLRRTGQPALQAVRRNASWSTTIPRATVLQISLAGKRPGVAIVTKRIKARQARNLEHQGKPGRARAPLFGNPRRWFSQPAKPFMLPEAPRWQAEVRRGIGDAIDQVARRNEFR
jgi:hypothetical protein